ncbi:MAG: hypothetical protein AAGB22_04705, partial [Bacteroidota bacterium]
MEDVFLARYDTNGQFSWAFRLGSMDIEALQGMATDQDGNVFIAGRFGDTLDADPGAGVANLVPFNATLQSQVPDLYLVKYDSAGNYQWHRTIPETDTITTNNIASLATDTAGNVLVAATFGGSVDIDPGAGVVTLNAANGGSFVVAYDASGNYTGWHVQLDAIVTSIATDDAGNVAVTGSFQGTVDFDPTGNTLNLTSFGSDDVFVARYDQTTAPIYAFRFGSLGQDQGSAIASTADGKVAVTGTFTGTVDFDPGLASTTISALSIPTFDLFVAHYDASGNFEWVRQAYLINGPSVVPTGIAVDADTNVLVSGHYNQTLVFPAGGDTVTLTNPNIDPNNPMLVDVFLTRYNADGVLQWGISPAGPGSNLGLSVATDMVGNAYIAGQFEDSVQFDPVGGANQITYPSVPQLWNGYLAKYRSPFTVQATGDSAVACFGDTSASATASVTNGAVPLTYAWSNGGNTPTINSLGAGTYTVTITDENGEMAIDSVTVVEPTLLSLVSQQTNVLCNGDATGNVSVTPSGGTMPYAYAWSSGATTPGDSSLTAGTYTVTVTDANSCTETGTLAVIEPSPLTFSILSQSNVLCAGENNGTTTITAFGGVIPHTYQWSTGSTLPYDSNLVAGTHTITITDANGCITAATTVITQPADLMLSVVNQFNVPCNGGTNGAAAVTTIGGVLPYNYLWSTGTTIAADGALPAGTHQITVTDGNGCTDTDSVVITEPTALGDTIIGVVDLACFGDSNGSATVVGTGGTLPYNFQWSTGTNAPVDNALPGGPHTVTITDANNCQRVTLVVIDEPDSLWALLAPTPIICAG